MRKHEIRWQIRAHASYYFQLFGGGELVQQETLLARDLNACRAMPFAGDALCSPTFARHVASRFWPTSLVGPAKTNTHAATLLVTAFSCALHTQLSGFPGLVKPWDANMVGQQQAPKQE